VQKKKKYRAKWLKDLSVISLELGAALMTPAGCLPEKQGVETR